MTLIVASVLFLLFLHRGKCLSPHETILGKEKVTHLHFFFHDFLSGDNPNALEVTIGNPTSPTRFGSTIVMDSILTEEPQADSRVVGNAQGFYSWTGKEKFSLVMDGDFEFTTGEFNGSSICIFSRNTVLENRRELAVVGGRGKFRFARGFAMLKTHFVNFTSRDAIVEYHVTVLHYEMN